LIGYDSKSGNDNWYNDNDFKIINLYIILLLAKNFKRNKLIRNIQY